MRRWRGVHGAMAGMVLALLGLPGPGAQARGLTPDLALGLSTVSEAALSPDGDTLAYRLERPPRPGESRHRVGEFWIRPATDGAAVRLSAADASAHRLRWSPDGRALAWIARAADASTPQVHVLEALAAPRARVATDAGAVEAFEWSPDGRWIAYLATDAPSAAERQARDEGRDAYVFGENERPRRLYVVEASGTRPRRIGDDALSVMQFAWSPDGRRLAFTAAPGPSLDEQMLHGRPYVAEVDSGAAVPLAGAVGPLAFPAWTPDGRWIAWLGAIAPTDPWHGSVFAVPADGSAGARNLSGDHVGTATWMGPAPGRPDRLAVVFEERQSTVLRWVDPVTGTMTPASAPSAVFSGGPAFARDGRFAVVASTPSHPAEAFVGGDAGVADLRRVTHSNPQLDGVERGRQEEVRWRSRDGLEIEGILIKPVGFRDGVRYPVVVHVHGGSESVVPNGWRGSYIDWGQPLAARGYVVIYPNYRGSRGRGTAFVAGNRRDLMGREWEDIESALDHVVSLGIADPARAGIYGFSWGGYAAGWGATYASHRFAAAVGGAGIYNWISEAGSNDTRMHEQVAHWDAPLYEHFGLYLERSPIFEVRRANTPLLMLHGEDDASCPLGQAIEMHTALKWKGVPVELVVYPREGHGMAEYPHQRDFLARGLAWFDRYLRPEGPVDAR